MRGHDAQLRAVLIHHAHLAVADLLIDHEIVVDRNTPPVDPLENATKMSGAKRHSHKTPCLGMDGIMMTRAGDAAG